MTYPRQAIDQAFALLPAKLDTKPARRQHAAIAYQESRFANRRQLITVDGKTVPQGPAVSYWQFERGGIKGVMNFYRTQVVEWAKGVCKARGVPFTVEDVWHAMETDDVLGAAFARLLMYTDAEPVPATQDEGWSMYVRTWRPGKPHLETWRSAWAYGLEFA